jgi:bifunctional ADP-heptose synthase (sugar kinase/adenylyltransferase)
MDQCRLLAVQNDCPLFVGIDSDKRVWETKGDGRPFNTEDVRAEFLLSFRGIDRVFVYDTTEELESIVSCVSPIVMVVGDEYRNKVVGERFAKTVVYFPRIPNYSSTSILKDTSIQKDPK